MSEQRPKVSIGLPVYNGACYLEAAAQSVLDQTVDDLELVISDNASTDETVEVCRELERRDPRVRLLLSDANHGAAWNYNTTFAHAKGRYFKWAAHDDWLAPTYLEQCLDVLERDPDVVLCHTRVTDVDEDGKEVQIKGTSCLGGDADPVVRFRSLMQIDYDCEEVFGLIRSDALAKTAVIAPYPDSDRTLLAELALRGRLVELEDPIFYHRVHSESSVRVFPGRQYRYAWFDPGKAGRFVYPHWRQLREVMTSIRRSEAPLRVQAACLASLVSWCATYRGRLLDDLDWAARRLARIVVRGRAD